MDNRNQSQGTAGQKSDDMQAMDQGLNLVSQTFNNATGVDKGNDGKKNNNQ